MNPYATLTPLYGSFDEALVQGYNNGDSGAIADATYLGVYDGSWDLWAVLLTSANAIIEYVVIGPNADVHRDRSVPRFDDAETEEEAIDLVFSGGGVNEHEGLKDFTPHKALLTAAFRGRMYFQDVAVLRSRSDEQWRETIHDDKFPLTGMEPLIQLGPPNLVSASERLFGLMHMFRMSTEHEDIDRSEIAYYKRFEADLDDFARNTLELPFPMPEDHDIIGDAQAAFRTSAVSLRQVLDTIHEVAGKQLMLAMLEGTDPRKIRKEEEDVTDSALRIALAWAYLIGMQDGHRFHL